MLFRAAISVAEKILRDLYRDVTAFASAEFWNDDLSLDCFRSDRNFLGLLGALFLELVFLSL